MTCHGPEFLINTLTSLEYFIMYQMKKLLVSLYNHYRNTSYGNNTIL